MGNRTEFTQQQKKLGVCVAATPQILLRPFCT